MDIIGAVAPKREAEHMECPRCGAPRDAERPDGCRDWKCPDTADMRAHGETP